MPPVPPSMPIFLPTLGFQTEVFQLMPFCPPVQQGYNLQMFLQNQNSGSHGRGQGYGGNGNNNDQTGGRGRQNQTIPEVLLLDTLSVFPSRYPVHDPSARTSTICYFPKCNEWEYERNGKKP